MRDVVDWLDTYGREATYSGIGAHAACVLGYAAGIVVFGFLKNDKCGFLLRFVPGLRHTQSRTGDRRGDRCDTTAFR
jgi:hypothetical protein